MKSIIYRVTKSMTVSELARKNNTTVDRIMSYNKLIDNQLYCGQRVVIPFIEGKLHIVKPFEEIEDIARHYSCSVEKICKHNGLDSPVIFIGQRVIIPE